MIQQRVPPYVPPPLHTDSPLHMGKLPTLGPEFLGLILSKESNLMHPTPYWSQKITAVVSPAAHSCPRQGLPCPHPYPPPLQASCTTIARV